MLKKEEWIVLAVFLLFAFLFVQFNHEVSANITGLVVGNSSEPSFEVLLERTQMNSGDLLKGSVNLTFAGPFSPSTVLKVDFNGVSNQVVLKDYFKSKNMSFTETESSSSTYNPTTSKMLNFESAGSKSIALQLPKASTVKQISMSLIGSPESPTKFVSFDVNDYANKKEWKHFGDFISFKSDYTYPSSLTIGSEGDPSTIGGQLNHNKTYFCEAINLAESKHFKLAAKLKKLAEGADVKAILLSFDGQYASGGADFCDLSEPGAIADWQTCDLSFPTSKQGTYLVCVFYVGDTDKDYYEISRDSTVSNSRFDCPIEGGSSLCFPSTSKDYFIGIKTADYSGVLNKTLGWEDGLTDQAMNYSLTALLAECKANDVGDCAVPVTVSSESAGALQLGNLKIDYVEAGGSASYTNKFYDITQVAGSINNLGGVDLSNASKTLQISISDLNITAPKITKNLETLYLEVYLTPGGRISQPITVYGEGYVVETGTVEEKITNTKKVLSDMSSKYSEELDLFGITIDTKQLESFESEVNTIKSDKNLSVEEINAKLSTLSSQIDTYLQSQPKGFDMKTSFKDLYISEPGDVGKVVLEDSESVYFYQSNVEVTVEVSNYVLEKYNGGTEKYSVIKKTITPQKTLSNVYIYEVIPKTLASSVANIVFKNKDYEVVQQDPIVRYTFTSLSQPTTIGYGVEDVTVTQNMLLGLGSIIVPKKIEEIVEKEYECGDGICTEIYEDSTTCPEDCPKKKIPWLFIIILIVLLAAGVVYINFYRGKGSFRRLIGMSPFANPKDLENVKDYIRVAQGKGLKNPEIAKALLQSSWTKDQIIYAFEDLKWDEKRLFTIKLAPGGKENTKKLQNFIKKCLELNISKGNIKNTLLQKGWSADKVDEAFAKIGEPQEKVETPKEKEKKVSYYFEKSLEEEIKK
ncbi:MAG: hypothetical protein Q8O03_04165 [Nanoarchaeota archaeon]|nr:hypothetical protein [Nanoarchaeota archaeon]